MEKERQKIVEMIVNHRELEKEYSHIILTCDFGDCAALTKADNIKEQILTSSRILISMMELHIGIYLDVLNAQDLRKTPNPESD